MVGSYAYLDGEMHVRLSLAMDAIVKGLTETRPAVMVRTLGKNRSCVGKTGYHPQLSKVLGVLARRGSNIAAFWISRWRFFPFCGVPQGLGMACEMEPPAKSQVSGDLDTIGTFSIAVDA